MIVREDNFRHNKETSWVFAVMSVLVQKRKENPPQTHLGWEQLPQQSGETIVALVFFPPQPPSLRASLSAGIMTELVAEMWTSCSRLRLPSFPPLSADRLARRPERGVLARCAAIAAQRTLDWQEEELIASCVCWLLASCLCGLRYSSD